MSPEEEFAAIMRMPKESLKTRWRAVRQSEPPPGLSAALMRNALIYAVQEKRFGGLPTNARRRLERIAARLAENPDALALESETPAPGTRFIREWRGRRHVVEVLNEGFAYRGTVYGSLSEIARIITGAHWSGPRFFGLKNRRKAA